MKKIAIIDFGGQYTHLIANRIRRLGVYSEIMQAQEPAASFAGYAGIILSGSPHSVLTEGHPTIDPAILKLKKPMLGLCYGHQLLCKILGGQISKGFSREYGVAEMKVGKLTGLFYGLNPLESIWMSHGDSVAVLPKGFEAIACTDTGENAAVYNQDLKIWGLQFHPEVTHTVHGMEILGNFLEICECERDWKPSGYLEKISTDIKRQCGNKKVFLLVSGGVDSTVAFTLLNKVLGADRVHGLHVDNGLMRADESAEILVYMKKHGFDNLAIEHAAEDFVGALSGVSDPEKKRTIIGEMFMTVQKRAQERLGLNVDEWLLAQGTIYPDTIESAGTVHADKIKTHHNRVDVILEMIEKGLIIEPLAQLYKDEVRALGSELGLPKQLIWRHPFPGPGLGVRLLCSNGEVDTIDKKVHVRSSECVRDWGFTSEVLPLRSVGVQGDSRSYAHPLLLTGELYWEVIEKISTKVTNTVPEINRVVYNLSGKRQDGPYRLIKAFVTTERLDLLREVDRRVTGVLHDLNEYNAVWQMPVVLLPLVNDAGKQCVVLRPIQSQEAMTARFVAFKSATMQAFVEAIAGVPEAGDVFYDVTHKPPGTIEWE